MFPSADKQRIFIAIKNFSVIHGCSLLPGDVKTILKGMNINPREQYGFNTLSEMLKEIPEIELRNPKVEGEEPQVIIKFLAEMHSMYETPFGQEYKPRPEVKQRKQNWVMPERSLPVRIEGDKVVVSKKAAESAEAIDDPAEHPEVDVQDVEDTSSDMVADMEADMAQEAEAEAALFNSEGEDDVQDQQEVQASSLPAEEIASPESSIDPEPAAAPAARPKPRF